MIPDVGLWSRETGKGHPRLKCLANSIPWLSVSSRCCVQFQTSTWWVTTVPDSSFCESCQRLGKRKAFSRLWYTEKEPGINLVELVMASGQSLVGVVASDPEKSACPTTWVYNVEIPGSLV